jgi:hypothetical protein
MGRGRWRVGEERPNSDPRVPSDYQGRESNDGAARIVTDPVSSGEFVEQTGGSYGTITAAMAEATWFHLWLKFSAPVIGPRQGCAHV